ncbi:hypothetical protein [Paenibacillus whitsoniae]|uniref:hypothetical protein n=1 Tax=Paenibacillus whitsoniae TaxID=2496558 RepID=UPI0013E0A31D|nr:hypothetical protein [Paenibacillus whitsoniae]
MNSIFAAFYLLTLAVSIVFDRKALKNAKKAVKVVYICTILFLLLIFTSQFLHIVVPMPIYFFIHTVSPWLVNALGLQA